eukprot:TRINITY_DN6080_c0_g1_i1.p1 TRINITY_DN6080_c0_g1~~TRINITY_DN6080_c0_g1_i1.p1  ORF type:complete len:585 (-),score=111.12 TRINITY_DN6080_c0_g1_i1:90-1844(-)
MQKSDSSMRWLLLLLTCLSMTNYFCYDIPTVLKRQLCDAFELNGNKINDFEYNLFYSMYALPNVLLSMYSGRLIDKIGASACMMMFSFASMIGQALFSYGLKSNLYYLALIGRAVLGIGGETLTVGASALLTSWFKETEIAFSMGLGLVFFVKVSIASNDWLSPMLASDYSLQAVVDIGFLACAVSFICSFFMFCLTKWAEYRMQGPIHTIIQNESMIRDDDVQLRDVVYFNSRVWLLCFSCVFTYASVMCWTNIGSDFLQEKYSISATTAGRWLAIPTLIVSILTAFLNPAIGHMGQRATLLVFSSLGIAAAHALFAFTNLTAFVPLTLLGVGFAINVSALWPCVSLVLEEVYVGTAFGVINMCENIGLTLIPMGIGLLSEHVGFYYCQIVFVSLAILGLLFNYRLLIEDNNADGKLNDPIPDNRVCYGTVDALNDVSAEIRSERSESGAHSPLMAATQESDTDILNARSSNQFDRTAAAANSQIFNTSFSSSSLENTANNNISSVYTPRLSASDLQSSSNTSSSSSALNATISSHFPPISPIVQNTQAVTTNQFSPSSSSDSRSMSQKRASSILISPTPFSP